MVILPGVTTSWTRNPPEEWLFRLDLPPHGRGIHLNYDYSTGNYRYHLTDEETTGGMVIPPGIAGSWAKNPPEVPIFIPSGSTSSGMMNPPEKSDSTMNYQLIDKESTQGRGFRQESPAHFALIQTTKIKMR
jgi:hypothetical protein